MISGAAAQEFAVSCVKGADARTIEIVSPGQVGEACDVNYQQADGSVRTPYHANNTPLFCREKADELVANLISAGFACGEAGGVLTAEARPAPAPVATVAPTAPASPTPDPLPAVEAASAQSLNAAEMTALTPEPAAAPDETAAPAPTQTPTQTSAPVQMPAPVELATPVTEAGPTLSESDVVEAFEPATDPAPTLPADAAPAEFETEAMAPAAMAEIAEAPAVLDEPAALQDAATRAPATLVNDQLADVRAAPAPTAGRRLVGASPEPAAQASPRTGQQVIAPAPISMAPAPKIEAPTSASPAAASASVQPASAPQPGPGRSPQDIIVATLAAQTAAWNEGDLDAFMAYYWNNKDLKFVSGTQIHRGWTPTLRRYRDRYADESGLGRLGFSNTDVRLITEDVAVVTGRYQHQKGEAASSGVFSLVMKRINGAWRIVHDHTVADPL